MKIFKLFSYFHCINNTYGILIFINFLFKFFTDKKILAHLYDFVHHLVQLHREPTKTVPHYYKSVQKHWTRFLFIYLYQRHTYCLLFHYNVSYCPMF